MSLITPMRTGEANVWRYLAGPMRRFVRYDRHPRAADPVTGGAGFPAAGSARSSGAPRRELIVPRRSSGDPPTPRGCARSSRADRWSFTSWRRSAGMARTAPSRAGFHANMAMGLHVVRRRAAVRRRGCSASPRALILAHAGSVRGRSLERLPEETNAPRGEEGAALDDAVVPRAVMGSTRSVSCREPRARRQLRPGDATDPGADPQLVEARASAATTTSRAGARARPGASSTSTTAPRRWRSH